MRVQPFSDEQFSATKFYSAQDKARWANSMAAWAEHGFPDSGFTKAIYIHLSTHMYGHIAHYNIQGFYQEWFSDNNRKLEWLKYAASGGAFGMSMGNPAYTWSDVERAFSAWIIASGLIQRFEKLCADETEAQERAQLARLQEKYPG